jgi:hypothetical protein
MNAARKPSICRPNPQADSLCDDAQCAWCAVENGGLCRDRRPQVTERTQDSRIVESGVLQDS